MNFQGEIQLLRCIYVYLCYRYEKFKSRYEIQQKFCEDGSLAAYRK